MPAQDSIEHPPASQPVLSSAEQSRAEQTPIDNVILFQIPFRLPLDLPEVHYTQVYPQFILGPGRGLCQMHAL